jgi:hypothetical protein
MTIFFVILHLQPSLLAVVRENVIAGEEPKNQQHPERSSLTGAYEDEACVTLLHGFWRNLLKDQTEFSIGQALRQVGYAKKHEGQLTKGGKLDGIA